MGTQVPTPSKDRLSETHSGPNPTADPDLGPGDLYDAATLIGLARSRAFLRGDPRAAERLELLLDLVMSEHAYDDNIRLGNPVPEAATAEREWMPGRPSEEMLAWLERHDAHHHQLHRIAKVVEPTDGVHTVRPWVSV